MEEQPKGSVVATLIATDSDSNIAEYVIDPENEYFHIDKASGKSFGNKCDFIIFIIFNSYVC